MLVLYESASGFALLKVADDKLENVDNLYAEFADAQSAQSVYVRFCVDAVRRCALLCARGI